MHQGLRVERTGCEDVYGIGCTKYSRAEHVKQDVLSIEWVGAISTYFRIEEMNYIDKNQEGRCKVQSRNKGPLMASAVTHLDFWSESKR